MITCQDYCVANPDALETPALLLFQDKMDHNIQGACKIGRACFTCLYKNISMLFFLWADSQLDAAIKHLQDLIEDDPRNVPQTSPYPDKSVK